MHNSRGSVRSESRLLLSAARGTVTFPCSGRCLYAAKNLLALSESERDYRLGAPGIVAQSAMYTARPALLSSSS